jgi:hypothetical protein
MSLHDDAVEAYAAERVRDEAAEARLVATLEKEYLEEFTRLFGQKPEAICRNAAVSGDLELHRLGDNAWHLLGICPYCDAAVFSVPLRSLAELGQQLAEFKPSDEHLFYCVERNPRADERAADALEGIVDALVAMAKEMAKD